MTDYKELTESLVNMASHYDHFYISRQKALDIVTAIEHLAKELNKKTDDYEILAKMYAKVSEDLCVITKERDEAIADIHWLIVSQFTTGRIDVCKICRNYNEGNFNNECKNCHVLCPYGNFSWRGVQNE